MPSQLPKKYIPEDHEARIRQQWDDAQAFHADPSRVLSGEKPPYCILIPPPNVTAALHLGHALNNTLQDVLIRSHRMMGYETLWMPGTDHAGIATQTVVDKRLQAEGKPALADYKRIEVKDSTGRDQFIAIVQSWKDEYEQQITDQLIAMGCSCDFARQRFTMDPLCARAVRQAFFQLFKADLIYRGKRLVNWDPATQTALSDDEVENVEIQGHFYYLRYPLVHKPTNPDDPFDTAPVTWDELATRGYPGAASHAPNEPAWVTVATTRPETYLGDTAVAINPTDHRAKPLKSLFVQLPLVGRVIPIIEDSYVVLPDPDSSDTKAKFATGFLKVTPAHDPNDWELGQRHNLPIINIMAPDASISADHGWNDYSPHNGAHVFIGKSREEARKLVIREFEARQVGPDSSETLLEDIQPHTHSVGHSYRSHVAIEPYLSDQWYVKVTDDRLKGTAQRALNLDQRTQASLNQWPESHPNNPSLNEPRPSGSGLHSTNKPQPSENQPLSLNEPRPSGSSLHSTNEPSSSETGPRISYLITFTTYGTWLHGNTKGSADRNHNLPGTPYLPPDTAQELKEEQTLKHDPVELDQVHRSTVADAIREVCEHRNWELHACNVRSNHVHVVVSADATPERVMNDLKSYATRAMRNLSQPITAEHVWTRHGSTRYLNTPNAFNHAIKYTLEEQGEDLGGVIRGTTEVSRPLPHGRGSFREDSLNDSSLSFHPPRYAKTYESWHDNLQNWCISRQLWWGHRIPVWALDNENHNHHPDVEAELRTEDWEQTKFAHWEKQNRISIHRRGNAGGVDRNKLFSGIGFKHHLFICVRDINDSEIIDFIEQNNTFVRDPDVLDTWFSSALWPLSTLGWPDVDSAAKITGLDDFPQMLKAFNPSTVLCTAREIITLWVSRMVMFNRFFLGEQESTHPTERAATVRERSSSSTNQSTELQGPAPFRDVFIHAMIQDGQGRKMSKSLGNGVDPRDIIHSHGTDAMRYTLCQMTTQTQDVRLPVSTDPESGKNTSPKFDIGRNFCNKLWNAARFTLSILTNENNTSEKAADQTALIDQWMASRVRRTSQRVRDHLSAYNFNQISEELYDLLWRDFCDWYLEGIKSTVSSNPNQRAMLRTVLETIIRLLHPICPFITEAIHEQLRQIPVEDVPGFTLGSSNLLATAPWPELADTLDNPQAESAFIRLQELVTAIREVRAQHQVPPKRKISLHVSSVSAQEIQAADPVAQLLAGLDQVTTESPPSDAVAFVFDSAQLHLSNLADQIDANAERQRLDSKIQDLDQSISALEARLANPGYSQRAPAHLVEQTREQLARAQADRKTAVTTLESLETPA